MGRAARSSSPMTRRRRTCQISGDRTNPPLTAVGASQENRSRMARLLGLVVTLLLASLAVVAPAFSATPVVYLPAVTGQFGHGSILTITGDDVAATLNDNVSITQNA